MTRSKPSLDAIANKRAIRRFAERPLDEAHLATILHAGRRAASSKNQQRWAFIVCCDRTHLQALAAVGPYAGHLAGAAVGIALVTPDPRRDEAPLSLLFDLGQAADSMMLAAWDVGVGSVPATVYDHDLAQRLLGYPDDQWCEFLLSFGYPADPSDLTRPPKVGGRVPLEALIHEERW
jgi:nitroreductase